MVKMENALVDKDVSDKLIVNPIFAERIGLLQTQIAQLHKDVKKMIVNVGLVWNVLVVSHAKGPISVGLQILGLKHRKTAKPQHDAIAKIVNAHLAKYVMVVSPAINYYYSTTTLQLILQLHANKFLIHN